jgi:hypothetical protein
VLSDRGLCDELITGPVESYRMWCVVGCDLDTSQRRPRSTQGCRADDNDDDDDDVQYFKENNMGN